MFGARININRGGINFVRVLSNTNKTEVNNQAGKNKDANLQSIFLLSKNNSESIFDNIPKNFTILTKDKKYAFNLNLLQDASKAISDFVIANPNEKQYFLNINDEEDVLSKFEQLFSGKRVEFVEDELPSCQKITKTLKILHCPNFLKPESLRTREIAQPRAVLFSKDAKMEVEINTNSLINFFNRPQYLSFKITTKKNEYMCNIFGVYSSKILRKILNEGENIDHYDFDYEDEYDEFQLICDFFNCQKIAITKNNMDSLKQISEELEIECIIGQITNFIKNYETNSQKIDEHQKIIDSIDELFDLLYNIKTIGIEQVKISIEQSKWSKNEENIQELAAFILQVIKPDYSIQREIADLLIELNKESNESNRLNLLIPFIVNNLMIYYMPQPTITPQEESYFNESIDLTNKCVYSFIRILYKKGIISKEEIIEKLKYNNYQNQYLNAFFLPELIEINPKSLGLILKMNHNFETSIQNINFILLIKKYLPDNIDAYEKMLDEMEPSDELTKALRNDDVDTFQSIITINSIDINNTTVPYNIFDNFESNQKLINYAAFCGSLKCFKYLILNNGDIDDATFYFAVYGGNIEIIKIIDQKLTNTECSTNHTTAINSSNISRFSFNRVVNFSVLWFNINNYGFDGKNIQNRILTKRPNDDLNGKLIKFYDSFVELKVVKNISTTYLKYGNANNIIASTIALHRNDLFDWIFEKKFLNKEIKDDELINLAILSAATGNAHSLIEIIDKGFDISSNVLCDDIIYFCAKSGFYKLTKLLISITKNNFSPNKSVEHGIDFYKSSVVFGNLSIFKLFIEKTNMPVEFIEKSISIAIELNYKDIVYYYFNNNDKIGYFNDIKLAMKCLKLALKATTKTAEIFIFLFENYKKLFPCFNNLETFTALLDNACLCSNLLATKYITDLILNEYPGFDFTSAFVKASSSSSMEICYYFIDKKVYINYYEFSSQIEKLGSMDAELFEMIYNQSDPNTKNQLFKCIGNAIENKNKLLIDFLLKEKAPMPYGLFCAVMTHDIEIVDLILKYNSTPSFVNTLATLGTAICYASSSRDLDIVKRLLSIPGIDPSLFTNNGDNALTAAINNYDIDIVNCILDFYGDDIALNMSVVSSAFITIYNCLNGNQADKLAWEIAKRFLSIKTIDPNYIVNNNSLLIKACSNNEIEMVEFLLKLDRINVNQYEVISFLTPLMISVNNRNLRIAQLLLENQKTNINMRNYNNESALILAVKKNQKEIVDLLINDKRFDQYESKLSYALILSNDEIFGQLSLLDFLDVNNFFSLSKYKKNNTYNVITSKSYVNYITTPLAHFAKINDIDRIDVILKHHSFDKYKSDINSAIFYTVEENNIDLFRKLIKLIDDDVNIYNKRGKSFLVVAAIHSSGDIIDELFDNKLFDPRKNQICRAFIESYSNPHCYRQVQAPVIQNPPLNYHPQRILNQQLLPNKSSTIETMTKIFNYDLNHGQLIDLNKLAQNGKSFFTSIRHFNDETSQVCDFLLNIGADPNIPDSDGVYPLEYAISSKSASFVNSLLNSNKIELNQKLNRNRFYSDQSFHNETTYFHLAASCQNAEILRLLLLKNPSGINETDELGETPLMSACRAKSTDCIILLFKQDDLDYLHLNNEGKDAIEIINQLETDELSSARKSKEQYYEKIMLLIKEQNEQ